MVDESGHVEADDHDGQTVKTIRIVKCGLRRAIGLPNDKYQAFSATIEAYVKYVSQAMRRASLALLYHLTDLSERGQSVPDLFNQKDTWWKDWLRLGNDAPAALGLSPELMAHLDPAPTIPDNVTDLDQVIAYAAGTFKTAVCNTAYVPLFSRLQRLIKAEIRNRRAPEAPVPLAGPSAATVLPPAYLVLQHLRSAEPSERADWPEWLNAYINDIRRRLGAKCKTYLHDDWGKGMAFQDLFAFNYWMQLEFERLETRRIALSPVMSVGRKHVRLDRRILVNLCTRLFPQDPLVREVRTLEARHKEEREAGLPGFLHPDRHMLDPHPAKKTRQACSEEEWLQYKVALEAWQAHAKAVRQSSAYQHQLRKHQLLETARTAVTKILFADLPVPKNRWTFDGSLVTDGVAVSLQFAQHVPKPSKPSKKPARKTSRAKKVQADGEAALDYDRHLSTYMPSAVPGEQDVLVLGFDPGRVKLVTVSYVLDEQTNRLVRERGCRGVLQDTWSLSKGEYLTTSGIRHMDIKKAQRTAPLHAAWSNLGQGEASLRTSWTASLRLYMSRALAISQEWWDLMLRRRESRDNLRRYANKRSVLDGFFARIKRELARLFPTARVEVGYGSAVQSMKPTGKSECAVPTTGVFRACQRIFGKQAVAVVDEHNSTKKEWETGAVKEKVFAVFERDSAGGIQRILRHTTAKYMPLAADAAALEVLEEQRLRMKAAAARRRGGRWVGLSADNVGPAAAGAWMGRYPEVRGLRFSQERRKFLDRDREAARTIGRLRTLELRGLPRPAPFCRGGGGAAAGGGAGAVSC